MCIYNHTFCCFNGPIIWNILWIFSHCYPIVPYCHNKYSQNQNKFHHNSIINYCSIIYHLLLLTIYHFSSVYNIFSNILIIISWIKWTYYLVNSRDVITLRTRLVTLKVMKFLMRFTMNEPIFYSIPLKRAFLFYCIMYSILSWLLKLQN